MTSSEILTEFKRDVSKLLDCSFKTSYGKQSFDLDGTTNCTLYIKTRTSTGHNWGVTKNVLTELKKRKKPWFLVLLSCSSTDGYLLTEKDVDFYTGQFWGLKNDGDYKTTSEFTRNNPFKTLKQFKTQLLKARPTGQKSNADLLEGGKLHIQRARQVLPILVRQARAEETIYYSDLAEEVGMPNPRNLNYPLGAIGNALEALAQRTKRKKLPVINCLVVNMTDNLPGQGITWFIDKKDFDKQTRNQKEKTIDRLLANIYAYPDWYWVLDQLGLEPATNDYQKKLKPKKTKGTKRIGGRGGGESPQHLRFKNYIAKHPDLFGLPPNLRGQTEYELPSMDTIDVLFTNGDERIGIEVKSKISDTPDISRGLFQCVKYKALIEAEQKANDDIPNCRVALALEGRLPKELIGLKNQLGIEVFEKNKK